MTFHPSFASLASLASLADCTVLDQTGLPAADMVAPRCFALAPPRAFSEATAGVEEALSELRAAEAALERHLAELSSYIRPATAQALPAVSDAHAHIAPMAA